MYYICQKCKQRFGTTKPLEHGKLGIVMYPYEVPHNICDGKIIEMNYKEYMDNIKQERKNGNL